MSAHTTTKVTLTPDEVAKVSRRARHAFRAAKGRTKFEPGRGDDLAKRHLHGEGARAAVTKWLGTMPDDLRVHYTAYGDNLIINPTQPTGRYVLVTGRLPNYEIVGWAHSDDASRLGEWSTNVPKPIEGAWFIPSDKLSDPLILKVGW